MSRKSKKCRKMNPGIILSNPVINEELYEINENIGIDDADLKGNCPSKLYWPIYSYDPDGGNVIVENDIDYFPEIDEIKNSYYCIRNWLKKRSGKKLLRNGDFWTRFFTSQEAYIVDRFFSVDEYERLIDLMCEKITFSLNAVSILCLNHFEEVQSRNNTRNGKEEDIQVVVKIFNMKKSEGTMFEIHDRFVLLDDQIWHFGGTVGGVNLHLTAYSSGWKDCDGKFKEYLNEIITKMQ